MKIADRIVLTLLFSLAAAPAAELRGTVVDPSGAGIAGARVAAVNRVGVTAEAATGPDGSFLLRAPEDPATRLTVTYPGFATRSVAPADAARIELELAAQVDSVKVVGSSIDVAASEMPASTAIVSEPEIRARNEPLAVDLLRYVPGLIVNQNGARGALTGLYLRGGYPTSALVEIDGVPVNRFGGDYDLAHIPSEALERIEVVRGPQSSVHGPYANSGVINFVTRSPESGPKLDLVAEGGTYQQRRFGMSGAATLAGWGISGSASRLDADGPVRNNDYRGENLLLNVSRRFGRQSLGLHGNFVSNEAGVPGAWGSDPKHTFTGIDLISRNKNNFSDYFGRYSADITPRVRQELTGAFFLGNSGFVSQWGHSFEQNIRGWGDARTTVSVARFYTAAFGLTVAREQISNSYITNASYSTFPIERRDIAVYQENRFDLGRRVFLNAGVRGEFIRTPSIPSDGYARPPFPAASVNTANPKIAAAWTLRGGTRVHASFATGIRPPSGFDLAFTNNPSLQPERTRGFEAGIAQSFWRNRAAFDATYFYNRYHDLIVSLGGNLARLSRFQTDNIANSRTQGAEFSARFRPARWVFVTGSYTRLAAEILEIHGSGGLAPRPFSVGQDLIRRPADSGSVVTTFQRGKVTANVTGYFRGSTLDVEPGLGATNGLFRNPGFANVGINLNYSLGHGVTAYGNLRNALNRRYEEVLGYPSPKLNFLAGMRWTMGRGR
jgi:outer membrane receptor protein involved in Fe transport